MEKRQAAPAANSSWSRSIRPYCRAVRTAPRPGGRSPRAITALRDRQRRLVGAIVRPGPENASPPRWRILRRAEDSGQAPVAEAARYTLELALMAAGVPPKDVVFRAGTPKGRTALRQAVGDQERYSLVGQAVRRVSASQQKEAVMGLASGGRAFMAIVGARQPLDCYGTVRSSVRLLGIPRGAPQSRRRRSSFASPPRRDSSPTRRAGCIMGRPGVLRCRSSGNNAEIDLNMKPLAGRTSRI